MNIAQGIDNEIKKFWAILNYHNNEVRLRKLVLVLRTAYGRIKDN